MMVLGIDPGTDSGIAVYEHGSLISLQTYPLFSVTTIMQEQQPDMVVIEDSRLQSYIFTAPSLPEGARLKIARDIGRVDCVCAYVELHCEMSGTPLVKVSPKDKGSKVKAKQFNAHTGWTGQSNQHERDAGMVAWMYRRGANL